MHQHGLVSQFFDLYGLYLPIIFGITFIRASWFEHPLKSKMHKHKIQNASQKTDFEDMHFYLWHRLFVS